LYKAFCFYRANPGPEEVKLKQHDHGHPQTNFPSGWMLSLYRRCVTGQLQTDEFLMNGAERRRRIDETRCFGWDHSSRFNVILEAVQFGPNGGGAYGRSLGPLMKARDFGMTLEG
jgi:hypothetical protein